MKAEDLLAQANRKPFRPFAINLVDGDTILVDQEGIILHSDRRPELFIIFTSDGGRMRLFEESVIASIVQPNQ